MVIRYITSSRSLSTLVVQYVHDIHIFYLSSSQTQSSLLVLAPSSHLNPKVMGMDCVGGDVLRFEVHSKVL